MPESPFDILRAADDEGLAISRREIMRPVYDAIMGDTPKPTEIKLKPQEKVQNWRTEAERYGGYHPENFLKQLAEEEQFETNPRKARIEAYKKLGVMEEDIRKTEQQLFEESLRIPQVPVGTVMQLPRPGHEGSVDVAYPPDFPASAPAPAMVIWGNEVEDERIGRSIALDVKGPEAIRQWIEYWTGMGAEAYEDEGYVILGHMNGVDVRAGQVLKPGDPLGVTGDTGSVTGPNLHLEAGYGVPGQKSGLMDVREVDMLPPETQEFGSLDADTLGQPPAY